ncbi:AAA family ATPase [Chryseobacterium cucumeris]|uniref:AAA family ATPase n=1 Tax=Chryseobacterium cucumeris TaxID=1813611 RepID=UPI003D97A25E
MKLEKIKIKNFRRISDAELTLASSSFVIGPNNHGKTTVIDAIDALLSLRTEKVVEADFRQLDDGTRADTIELEGVFSNISDETAQSRGFKGRIINGKFTYKKTYKITSASKPKIESISFPYNIKEEFITAKTVNDLINNGIEPELIIETLAKADPNDKLPKGWEKDFIEVLNYQTDQEAIYEENPGGFSSNVNSKLPKVIRIPSLVNVNDFDYKDKGSSILSECLSLLFDDLLAQSNLATAIQEKLDQLEVQMNPLTEGSLIKKLIIDVNEIISSVFPACGIDIKPNLQNLSDILKPKYEVSLFSNVSTKIDKQGTGLIRTTAFAMLRYHSNLRKEKKLETRPVLVAFEEPEIYLHPTAANLLRDTIYSLGTTDQIICNTHSPWMIDLTQEPLSLTKMINLADGTISCKNYGLTSAFSQLPEDDKQRVKMLQLFDDEISRVFFADRVIIIEGDTELLTIKNTLKIIPENLRKEILAKTQIIRARGKASIISLVKYLHDLHIFPYVMHDRDQGTPGAMVFNQPIANVINDNTRLIVNHENIENTLGYTPPTSDKPYRAFIHTNQWLTIADIPADWKLKFELIFGVTL